MATIPTPNMNNCWFEDGLRYTGNFKFRLERVNNHFVITAGCATLVVHDFKEAQKELMKLFKKEYKDFFSEDNKST